MTLEEQLKALGWSSDLSENMSLDQWSKEEEDYWQRYLDLHGVDYHFLKAPTEYDDQNDFEDNFTDEWSSR